MDEKRFEREHAWMIRAVKEQKGDCPRGEVLVDFVQGDLDPEQTATLKRHLSFCGVCLNVVERLRSEPAGLDDRVWKRIQKRLYGRPAPWRPQAGPSRSWWVRFRIPAAAAAAAVVVLAVSVFLKREPSPESVSTVRGNLVQLQEPVGAIGTLEVFRWNVLPIAASFRLQLQEGEKLIWDTGTPEPRYRPPQELRAMLRGGIRYRWRVQGLDGAGSVVGESAWVEFVIHR